MGYFARHAMQASPAGQNGPGGKGKNVPVREQALETPDGLSAVLVLINRQQDGTVDQGKIHMTGWQIGTGCIPHPSGRRHCCDLQAGRPQPGLGGLKAVCLNIISARRRLAHSVTWSDKAGQIINMAIRVVMTKPLIKPDNLVDIETRPKGVFSLRLIPTRIPVRVQQALTSGHQSPGPIQLNRPALKDKIMCRERQSLSRSKRRSCLAVPRHDVFATPAIEPEAKPAQPVALPCNDGAGIPQPDIACGNPDQVNGPGAA